MRGPPSPRLSAAARWVRLLWPLSAQGPAEPGCGASLCPQRGSQQGKGVVQGWRPRIGRSSQVLVPLCRGLTRDPIPPSQHPSLTKTLLPGRQRRPGGRMAPNPRKWRQVATGDHGNARCAVKPDPDPASASRSHSPEGEPKEAAEERAAGGRRPGPQSGRLRLGQVRESGGLGLASVLPPPGVSTSVRQSVLPPVCPSQVRGPQPSLQQTAVVKRCRAQSRPSPSPANRCAPPRRLRTPPRRAARQVPAQKAESARRPEPGEGRTCLDRRAPGQRSVDRLDPEGKLARDCETCSLDAKPWLL